MATETVKPATGKLGVLVVGNGAVATTFMTGVLMARKGLAKPIGSMTQYDKMRVGEGADKKYLHYKDIVPLASLDDIVFGTWDVYPANAYEAAINAAVLKKEDILPVKEELEAIVPMKAAFDHNYAKRLDGDNYMKGATRQEMVDNLKKDIRDFKAKTGVERVVVLWAASTEVYVPVNEKVHYNLADFEAAIKADDKENIAPSMCYAYAALTEGAPFIMGAPNTTVDFPAMWELAEKTQMPIAGKDFKTGQTLVKSGFAPSSALVASALPVGSLPTSSVTATVSCSTNPPTSAQKKFRSSLHSNLSSCPKNSPTSTPTTSTRCASTTIPARRQQGRLGQHRHLRLDELPHADQDQLPLPRLYPCRSPLP